MKRNLTALWLTFSLLAALVVACSEAETDGPQTTGSGFLLSLSDGSLQVTTISGANEEPSTRTIPSELPSPVKEQFHVTILAEGGTTPLYDGPFTEQYIPAVPGRYTVSASYGSNPTLAWDTPYYSGSVSAIVEDRKPTAVTIPCAVANALVSVRFTNPSLFNQLYSDYGVIVANGDQSVRITPDKMAQSAYLPAESTDLRLTFSATLLESGNEVRFAMEGDLDERLPLGAGQHLILSLKASNTGLQIEKVEVKQESVSATIPDSWLPTPKVSGFGTINYVETNDAPTGATLSYTALRPLQDMELTFQFEDPQYSAYNKSYTLSALTEAERQELSTLGLTTLPQLGTTSSGSLDFAPLIATLQTNAGTTTTNAITLRVKANDRWSDKKTPATAQKVIVEKPEFSVSVMPEKVWSKEFIVEEIQVSLGNTNRIKSNLSYQYSSDGGQTWIDTNHGTLQQFASHPTEKSFKARALYRQVIASPSVDLTLEVPTQLPNSDMEEWQTASIKWEFPNYLPWSSNGQELWNTNNEFTLRYNVAIKNSYNGFPAVSYSYEHHKGNRCAELRNTAAGPAGTSFSIYDSNKVAGMLFLGDYTGTTSTALADGSIKIDEGRPFSVRPTHFSFWYTYDPYNSDGADTFEALVKVIDANGTVIGSGNFTCNKLTTSWTQQTIAINYTGEIVAKAAKIYVFFQSSNAGQGNVPYGKKRDVVLADDAKRTTHYGSVLRIDDLELRYDK